MAFKLRIPPSGMPIDPVNAGDVPGGVPGGPGGPGSLGLMPMLKKQVTCATDVTYTNTGTTVVPIVGPGGGDPIPLLDFGLKYRGLWPDVIAAGGVIMCRFGFHMQAEVATGSLPVVQVEVANGVSGFFSPHPGARHSVFAGASGNTLQYALHGAFELSAVQVANPVQVRAAWMSGTTNTVIQSRFDGAGLSGGGGWYLEAEICAFFPTG